MRAINAAKKSGARRHGVRQRSPMASVAGLMLDGTSGVYSSHSTDKALSPKARQAARASARRNAKNKGNKKGARVIGHRLKTQAPRGGVSKVNLGRGAGNAENSVLQKVAHAGPSYDANSRNAVKSGSPTALNPTARRKQLGGAQMASIFGNMGGDGAAAESTFGAKPQNVSSNAHASAAHMNYGNSITDRPSTRVNAPPGGKSQIKFGMRKPSRRRSRRERQEQQEKHHQRMRAAQEAQKPLQLPRQPKRQTQKQTQPKLQIAADKVTPLRTSVLNGNSKSDCFVAYNPYNEKSQVVQIDDLPTEGLCLKTPRGRAPRDCVNATREELMGGIIPASASTTATRVGGNAHTGNITSRNEFGSGARRLAPPGGRSSIKFI